MNCAFKGFFAKEADAEAAYYALRDKQLVYDLETSDLSIQNSDSTAEQVAYASEGRTMMAFPGSELFAVSSGNNDPRVALTPLLKTEEASPQDACYLYGHCRKKDINAVNACLKRCGASSVLTAAVNRPIRLHY